MYTYVSNIGLFSFLKGRGVIMKQRHTDVFLKFL